MELIVIQILVLRIILIGVTSSREGGGFNYAGDDGYRGGGFNYAGNGGFSNGGGDSLIIGGNDNVSKGGGGFDIREDVGGLNHEANGE
ncbi:uncharacterized protein LOC135431057 [Drosophila montana]|uniref:uncharacterized protein LOC135431057 n=1 Tax=Drosophila montana TaxID=40370 RepID=UPI00313C7ACE